jgi:hypothetical protein
VGHRETHGRTHLLGTQLHRIVKWPRRRVYLGNSISPVRSLPVFARCLQSTVQLSRQPDFTSLGSLRGSLHDKAALIRHGIHHFILRIVNATFQINPLKRQTVITMLSPGLQGRDALRNLPTRPRDGNFCAITQASDHTPREPWEA